MIKKRLRFFQLIFLIFTTLPMFAEFSLNHKIGMYDALQENGMQKTHTDYQIMYARPGETVYLYRPERGTFIGYVRWYCYDTDRAIPDTLISSTWPNDNGKFKKNTWGWFAFDYAQDRVTTADKSYIEIKYKMHTGDSIYRIACDEGIYKDYIWNNSGESTEATLSKRIIYEIRPAKWIADSLENHYKVTPEITNDNYLEEHELIAPINRQLYIGPNYMYRGSGKKIQLKQYHYYSRSNYHYYNSQGNITIPSEDANWKWYKDGVEDPTITLQDNSSQFVPVYSSTPDTVIYTLKYNPSPGYYFNIARFKVTYKDVNEVGPVEDLPAITSKIDKIYEQTFNFNRPGVSAFRFWEGHFDVDESTYGFYDINLDSQRKTRQGEITWSEYAVTNSKKMWSDDSNKFYLNQHKDSVKNTTTSISDIAKEGYMLYCDGSQQPGLVFNLKVNTNLCPGSTMYFSAWIADASSKKDKGGNIARSAPNLDFIVTGIDENGKEHSLTTFTTGEFGVNAAVDRSRGEWEPNKVNQMDRGIWYQIRFPVKFTAETTYPTYRLRITNKSTSSDGNDFAIDDVRIYVEKPPVMPIQASTSDCIDKAIDSIRSYIRVDYKEINYEGLPLYYQWREGEKIVKTSYFNVDRLDTIDSIYGKINILPDINITASDTCSDLLAFDKKYRDTEVPVIKYIEEDGHYVMYIAMPLVVRINHEYTSFVALDTSTLGDRSGCGTFANMLVAGGTRITINDEITFGDSVVTVCGHRSYTLNIVLTKIVQDESQGELRIDTTHCKADWLIGDSAYVNEHREIYKYTFDEIERGLGFYRQHVPSAIQMVNFLRQHGLLILDTASIVMNPGVSLSYTAFPIDGSASDGRKVCTSPRFLHIRPAEAASNMIEVGDSTEILPIEILNSPRIIRISNAKKQGGSFSIPVYLKGEEEEYIIDSVYLVSSTNPNWNLIKLVANHDTISLIDTITLVGDSDFKALEAGYDYTFHVAFKGEGDEDRCDRGYTYFTLRIIPNVVTWYGGVWNEDSSWDTFIPMKETNVILLTDTDYNVLFNEESLAQYDINYTENQCNHIYFPIKTSLAGQEKIIINGQAFIDILEYANKWNLTSIPINGVVSGDIFINQEESDDPFVVNPIRQELGTTAEDRLVFSVYQSEFDKENIKWLPTSNTLTRLNYPGEATLIKTACETDDMIPIVRLPKVDTLYRYFGLSSHNWLNYSEDIYRIPEYGKLSYNGDTIIELKELYNEAYLFGNPTLGYIDITKLVEDNSDKLTGSYFLEKEGIYDFPDTVEFIKNVNDSDYHILLPPTKGILLEGYSRSNTLYINVTPRVINSKGRVPQRRTITGNTNIATKIDNEVFGKGKLLMIFDIYGQPVGTSIIDLPQGFYILKYESYVKKIYKVN